MRGNNIFIWIAIGFLILAGTFSCQGEKVMNKKSQARDQVNKWKIHDPDRPQSSVVNPGTAGPPAVLRVNGKPTTSSFVVPASGLMAV